METSDQPGNNVTRTIGRIDPPQGTLEFRTSWLMLDLNVVLCCIRMDLTICGMSPWANDECQCILPIWRQNASCAAACHEATKDGAKRGGLGTGLDLICRLSIALL